MCPSYLLHLRKPGYFVFGIHQNNGRFKDSKHYLDIGVSVFHWDDAASAIRDFVVGVRTCPQTLSAIHDLNFLSSSFLSLQSGLRVDLRSETDEVLLAAGYYLVVPTTSMAKLEEFWDEGSQLSLGDGNKKLRQATLVIHGDVDYETIEVPQVEGAIARANLEPILCYGEKVRDYKAEKLSLWMHNAGNYCISLAIHNCGSHTYKYNITKVSASAALSMHSHRSWLDRICGRNQSTSFSVEVVVSPGEKVVLHHLVLGSKHIDSFDLPEFKVEIDSIRPRFEWDIKAYIMNWFRTLVLIAREHAFL